ncbi:MAG: Gfo/Idh/MocA family oxidoreductase [Verrucomicrobiota bacterium]
MKTKRLFTRRDMIKRTSTAGLIMGAPSILKANPLHASADDIRVGFIGCGKQQKVLYDAMLNIPGVRFVAACDIKDVEGVRYTRNLIYKSLGYLINTYTDAEMMLKKEAGHLDAVFIATPDFWHAPHTIMALESGCHVYCEKMMSDTLDGARSMVAAMDRTGKLCQIGHQRRSNPRYRFTLNQLIQKHRICGQIVDVNGQWNRSLRASREQAPPDKLSLMPDPRTLRKYGFDRGANGRIDDAELRRRYLNWRLYKGLSGGPISDLGAHQIDVFNWFLDAQPKSVTASGGHSFFKDREHFDSVMCIFDYDTPQGSVRAFYQVLTTTSAGGGYYEAFMGTAGTIEISEREAYTNIYKEAAVRNTGWDDLVTRGYLKKESPAATASESDMIASYASAPPDKYALPGGLGIVPCQSGKNRAKPPHQPHIENFFDAIRGKAKLTCDARHALESEAPIFWVNPAAEEKKVIHFTDYHLHT